MSNIDETSDNPEGPHGRVHRVTLIVVLLSFKFSNCFAVPFKMVHINTLNCPIKHNTRSLDAPLLATDKLPFLNKFIKVSVQLTFSLPYVRSVIRLVCGDIGGVARGGG